MSAYSESTRVYVAPTYYTKCSETDNHSQVTTLDLFTLLRVNVTRFGIVWLSKIFIQNNL